MKSAIFLDENNDKNQEIVNRKIIRALVIFELSLKI